MHYHIILTERCNSRCKYCYEKSMKEFENGLENKWEFEDVPFNSEVSISDLKKFLKPEDTLIFYGGEPILMLDKIREIIDNINCKFCIQTNGKLINEIPISYLKKFNKILVSIDGDKFHTDYNKGEGTYEKVISNLKKIRKVFKGEIVARMTIAQNFSDFFMQVKHLIGLGIFNSVHWQIDAGFYKNDFNFDKFSLFVKNYNKNVKLLVDWWLGEIKKGIVHKLYPFIGIFNSLYKNEPSKLRCGSGYSNYTITTNGKLVACPIMNGIKTFYCGDIKSGIKKEIHVVEPCTSCNYLLICGGRCLYSNYAKLWPEEGQKLICNTVINLIEEIKRILPEIKEIINSNKVYCNLDFADFSYEPYFGPEIVP